MIRNATERYPRVLAEKINLRKNDNDTPTGIVKNVKETVVLYR